MMEPVAVVRCSGYEPDTVQSALQHSIDLLGGLDPFLKPGERLMLKVNCLTDAAPERAVTTHPSFLRAVIRVAKTRTDRIVVADSPGYSSFLSACNKNGYAEVAAQEGVELVELVADDTSDSPQGVLYKRFPSSSLLRQVDRIWNLPKLKTHALMTLTLAIKNMFGLIPGTLKMGYHLRAGTDKMLFAQILVDIFRARPPDLNLVDGIVGMEGNGPSAGTPRALGLVVAGADGFSTDAAIARLLGVPLSRVPVLVFYQALQKGEPMEMEIRGISSTETIAPHFRLPAVGRGGVPDLAYRLGKRWMLPRPVFLGRRCDGCKVCVDICPTHCLKHQEGWGIRFREPDCIRCFCCQEMCPSRAIGVKKPFLSLFSK
jgi:uncharacterized protein (DUF362 family)/NAD-dependent dihydropyrimidine dehydrogenase PreA subunit